MFKILYQQIKQEESMLFFIGWSLIALTYSWGNTSLGLLFLLLNALYLGFKYKEHYLTTDRLIYKLIIIFIGWGLITSIFAYDPQVAFSASLGYGILLYTIFFGAKRLINYNDYLTKILLPLSSIGVTISSFYTLYLYFIKGLRRSHTFFVRINGTGTVLTIGFILLLAYFEYQTNKRRYLLLIPILSTLVAILVTYSRASWLGLIGAFSFYNLRSKKHIIILLIALALLFTIILSYTPLRNRFFSIFSLKKNKIRVFIWQGTLKMIEDNPVFGVGAGNFPLAYPKYRLEEDYQKNHPFSHNIFSNMAAELGLPGLFIYLTIIILILKMALMIANKNSLYHGLSAAFIGTLIREQFDGTILGLEIGLVFWLIAGLIAAFYFKEDQSK